MGGRRSRHWCGPGSFRETKKDLERSNFSWERRLQVAFVLNRHNFDRADQTLHRIMPRRWPVLMRNVARIPKIGDSFRDKTIIEFLRLIDLVPARHAPGMEMPDPGEILLDIP